MHFFIITVHFNLCKIMSVLVVHMQIPDVHINIVH
jgi:hypothetical protein